MREQIAAMRDDMDNRAGANRQLQAGLDDVCASQFGRRRGGRLGPLIHSAAWC